MLHDQNVGQVYATAHKPPLEEVWGKHLDGLIERHPWQQQALEEDGDQGKAESGCQVDDWQQRKHGNEAKLVCQAGGCVKAKAHDHKDNGHYRKQKNNKLSDA